MHEFYSTHSPVTDPAEYADLLDHLPGDLAGIARVTQGLVYHYVADEQFYGFKPPRERLPEIDTRTMPHMLARLREMDARPLSEARAYDKRLIGCCRDFALLGCAILRQQGRAARLRYGFASYLMPDYWIDHVIVEVWEGQRWRRFDPEVPQHDGLGFDILDLPEMTFATGGRAWQLCRAGADAARFGLGPGLPEVSGSWFVRGRLQLDIAALHKQELLCWDQWRYGTPETPLSADDEALLDRAAALSLQADSAPLRALAAQDERLRVPPAVTCYSPAVGSHEVVVVQA